MARKNIIVACIPAYNEEKTIAKVIVKTQKYVDKVLVCDDGSTDMTGEIAKRLGAFLIRHEKNLGKGAALRSLFNMTKKMGADIIITLDADDQHNPSDINNLVNEISKSNVDVILGSRFVRRNGGMPFYRRIGNRVLSSIINIFSHVEIKDTQCGLRIYSKKAINNIDVSEDGIGVDSQILFEINQHKLSVKEVPISCKYIDEGSTYNPVNHTIKVIKSILKIIATAHPIYFFEIPGIILTGIGLYGWFWVLNRFNEVRELPIGHSLVYTIILITGIFSIFTGLILYAVSNLAERFRELT